MVDSIKNTKFIIFARECEACAGGGFVAPSSFANELTSSYGGNVALVPCAKCVRGFLFQKLDTHVFLSQVSEHVVNEMVGALRGRWYDMVVMELESRIKDVELKIMGQQTALSGDVTGPASALRIGDRVRYKGNMTHIPGVPGFTLHPGNTGVVSEIRPYVDAQGCTGINAFVLFGQDQQRGTPLPPSLLEKIT